MDRILSNISILKNIVENSKLIIIITDARGKIVFVNKYFTKVTGYTANEVLNKNPNFLKSGILPKSFYKRMWETIKNGKTWQGTFINRKKDGTIYYENATISPILDEEGKIKYFVGIKHSITERENLIEETVKNTFNFVPLGIVVTDYVNRIVFLNETVEKTFNLLKKKAINYPFAHFFKIKDYSTGKEKLVCDIIKDSQKAIKIDKTILSNNGKSIVAELFVINIIKYQKVLGKIIMFNDITNREKQGSLNLNTDIEQLGVFLTGFSHDFNNLLAIAMMKLQTGKMLFDKDTKKAKKRIEEVEKTLTDISKLIQNFFETVSENTILSITNINELIKELVNKYKRKYPSVKFRIRFDDEFTIYTDREKLHFIIKSLLENAIEAQNERGNVEIFLKKATKDEILSTPLKEDSYIRISIRDYGKGIKNELLPLLFTPYFTTKNRTKEKQTGLSLAVCNFNIKKMGGYIKVITKEGKGSEFIIYLPKYQEKKQVL